ncbi:hypothetical protein [Allorhodopirellula solitaria]|uniref:Uncharacterized protein n=1 Tax=Allorhodopirellula solitaria TaxID=2527987 RepID=A0A5C5XVN1_9BACT|nr:hypothetical protein [Allorhodopirellula solitaria]TWT67377.1 hypothetical protein CA85_22270 [Allorhodopirellula solitaria]
MDSLCPKESSSQMTFWTLFADQALALAAAIEEGDAHSLSGIVDQLATKLVAEHPELNLNIGGDPPRLSILSLPGAETLAEKFVEDAPEISGWLIATQLPSYDPLESVHVSDDSGGALDVRYADLDATVLPLRDDGVTVVLSLDSHFDPVGPESHLYYAVAENVVFTILGGWPHALSKVVLLPRSQTGKLRPLDTLRHQWVEVVGPTRSA